MTGTEASYFVAGAERSYAVSKRDNWPSAELALCASRPQVLWLEKPRSVSEKRYDNDDDWDEDKHGTYSKPSMLNLFVSYCI